MSKNVQNIRENPKSHLETHGKLESGISIRTQNLAEVKI